MVHGIDLNLIACGTVDVPMNHALVGRIVVEGQFGNFVLVVRDIITNGPVPVLCVNRMGSQRKFDTLVLQGSNICQQLVAEIRTSWSSYGVQEVVSLAIVIIQRTCYLVVQETEVQPYVISRGLFPFQILVIGLRGYQAIFCIAEIVVGTSLGVGIASHIGIIAVVEVLLSCDTITQTEFQIRNSLHIPQERLVVDAPCQSNRRE